MRDNALARALQEKGVWKIDARKIPRLLVRKPFKLSNFTKTQ